MRRTLLAVLLLIPHGLLAQPDTSDTRLLQTPAGGEVGILGYPELMDGGSVTAPNFAFWSPEAGWAIENEGVAPDVEVENWPADVVAGRDPQLEKAIQIVLDELRKNPPARPHRPPYPIRVRRDQKEK